MAVPWARHHAGHTYAFDDTVAWLAVACSKTAVCELNADRLAHRRGDRGPGLGRHRKAH
ncbi:Transposase (part2) [Mycobacterium canettii CIPT 140070008]|nr:Transposase (part2) [Mycobacterium canettii CIPT 140070008]